MSMDLLNIWETNLRFICLKKFGFRIITLNPILSFLYTKMNQSRMKELNWTEMDWTDQSEPN